MTISINLMWFLATFGGLNALILFAYMRERGKQTGIKRPWIGAAAGTCALALVSLIVSIIAVQF